jgi:hypothetical protein
MTDRCHCQQFELYTAEAEGEHGEWIPPSSLQAFVDSLRETAWWERNFPQIIRVETHVRREDYQGGSVGYWKPHLGAGLVDMARCHLTELYICHEVAHVLADARYGSKSHDPWFARTYLELVYCTLGSDTYLALKAAFDRGGVDYDTDNSNPAGIAL